MWEERLRSVQLLRLSLASQPCKCTRQGPGRLIFFLLNVCTDLSCVSIMCRYLMGGGLEEFVREDT